MRLTLPIVIGRKYVRRDGTVVTARERHENIDRGQAYVGLHQDANEDPDKHIEITNGLTYPGFENYADLIADHVETAGHPHAALMLEYAQDAMKTAEPWKLWEYLGHRSNWTTHTSHPSWFIECEYRRKPRTIRIGEFDVLEPLREVPQTKSNYWLAAVINGHPCAEERFMNTPSVLQEHVTSGVAHLTREAAEQHARALLSFTEQK